MSDQELVAHTRSILLRTAIYFGFIPAKLQAEIELCLWAAVERGKPELFDFAFVGTLAG